MTSHLSSSHHYHTSARRYDKPTVGVHGAASKVNYQRGRERAMYADEILTTKTLTYFVEIVLFELRTSMLPFEETGTEVCRIDALRSTWHTSYVPARDHYWQQSSLI